MALLTIVIPVAELCYVHLFLQNKSLTIHHLYSKSTAIGLVGAEECMWFKVWNADTNQAATRTLQGDPGYIICQQDWEFNVEAWMDWCDTEEDGLYKVKLKLDGPIHKDKTERETPYMVFGDNPDNGNVKGLDMKKGEYTLQTMLCFDGI